jgi:hypothetical protein
MLTARSQETDKVLGLDSAPTTTSPSRSASGAARAGARGAALGVGGAAETCHIGDVVDFRTHQARRGDAGQIHRARVRSLRFFVIHTGQVVTDRILNQVWGYEEFPTTRTVDSFVAKLRQARTIAARSGTSRCTARATSSSGDGARRHVLVIIHTSVSSARLVNHPIQQLCKAISLQGRCALDVSFERIRRHLGFLPPGSVRVLLVEDNIAYARMIGAPRPSRTGRLFPSVTLERRRLSDTRSDRAT